MVLGGQYNELKINEGSHQYFNDIFLIGRITKTTHSTTNDSKLMEL